MRISLVRHGQKQSKIGDPALTEKGREQARLTGLFFQKEKVTHIFSSPAKRTMETAEFISKAVGLPTFQNNLLRERGDWLLGDGMSWDSFISEWHKASKDRDYQPSYGDTSLQAAQRLENAIESFTAQEIEHAILVSHGGIITDFLRNHFSDDFLIEKYYKHYSTLIDTSIPECSITTLSFDGKNWSLERICFTDHLLSESLE